MFTISNGGIQAKQMRRKLRENVPYPKRLIHNYPSVLIGRLAVSEKFQGKGIGSEILDFLKIWFSDSHNKTGCRFVIVDAVNEPRVVSFYEKNGFYPLFSSEEQEFLYTGGKKGDPVSLSTRLMYFDLLEMRMADERDQPDTNLKS